MMQENVRQDLMTLLPASIFSEIICFAFFDNHPRAKRIIDVLICTERGEVIEFYKRERLSSILLNTSSKLKQVQSFRNSHCDLFYITATEDELFVISSKERLILEHKISDVENYEIQDSVCNGQASLKITRKDDAVPLYFDDNFQKLEERCIDFEKVMPSDTQTPILMHLTRKLTEAKHNLSCNQNQYKEFVNLRQVATFYLYQKMCPNIDSSTYKIESKEILTKMHLKTWTPWIKLCNKKIVIGFNIINDDTITIEEVCMLLNSSVKSPLNYTTKIFEPTDTLWKERKDQCVEHKSEVTVITSIDLRELQNNIASKVEFDLVIAFKKDNKDYVLPFEKVILSASDIMGKDFDVLANPNTDEIYTLLAVLATSNKTELTLRHIRNKDDEPIIKFEDIFYNHLKMEKLHEFKRLAIHKMSPFHILHGVLVIFNENELETCGKLTIKVHSRCPSQVLSLIHYINDVVPFRIIATTPNYKITANTEQLAHYNEEIPLDNVHSKNYLQLGSSMLNQTSMLLEYLDKCMIKMNESKNASIQRRIGSEIDVFACGLDEFIDLREKLLKEVYSSIQKANSPMLLNEDNSEMMVDE